MNKVFSKLPKGIIFDCDGVIIDSFEANTHFYDLLRASVDLPPMTAAQRQEVHQLTGPEAMNLVIPGALQTVALKAYEKIDYVKDIVPMLAVNAGLHSLLEFCKEQGIFTGIHTNRVLGMTEILELNNLSQYFSPIMTPEVLPAKPNPVGALEICKIWHIHPSEAWFIGDSDNDRKTALAAQISFVAFKNPILESQYKVDDFFEVMNQLTAML